MPPKKYLSCAAVLLALTPGAAGCAIQHVRPTPEGCNPPFNCSEYTPQEDGFWDPRRGVFRVFLDPEGSLYLDPALHRVDDSRLQACRFSLREYYSGTDLYDPARVAEEYARRINDACRPRRTGGRSTALVILIHGINNSYPEARRSYEAARLVIRSRFPAESCVFLEVYWDGLHGGPLMTWGFARENSKWVGLGLRRLLSGIGPEIPVRVLTHSRGASVISAALWNVPLREEPKLDERYFERARELATPIHPSIRVAMIAPAMPEDDFDSYFDRSPPGAAANAHERIVVGVNEDDPAVRKGGLPWWIGGGTALGCDLSRFYTHVAPRVDRGRKAAFLVDLSASEVHDFKDYLFRRAFAERVLPLLFEDPDDAVGTGGTSSSGGSASPGDR